MFSDTMMQQFAVGKENFQTIQGLCIEHPNMLVLIIFGLICCHDNTIVKEPTVTFSEAKLQK